MKNFLAGVLLVLTALGSAGHAQDWYKCDPKVSKPKCCNPNSDPNCFFAMLPAAPAPSPDDFNKLVDEVNVPKAISLAQKFGKDPGGAATDAVIDAGIGILTIGYPPAGFVLGFLKGVILDGASGGPDPLGDALRQISSHINELQTEVSGLQSEINNVQNNLRKDENTTRQQTLYDIETLIIQASHSLRGKPDDSEIDNLLVTLQRETNKFVDPAFQNLWYWSDVNVTAAPGAPSQTKLMDPDFKSPPAFDHYSQLLTLWMAALQYASKGDPTYIVRRSQQDGTQLDLLKHAAFLSVRDHWNGSINTAQTVPERVIAREECAVQSPTEIGRPDPRTRTCSGIIQCRDHQRRTYWTPPNAKLTWTQPYDRNEACYFEGGPPPQVADQLQAKYGVDTMTNLATMLTRLANTGTLAPPYINHFDMTFYSKEWLYGVKSNGELMEYTHLIGVDKNGPQGSQPSSGNRALMMQSSANRFAGPNAAPAGTNLTKRRWSATLAAAALKVPGPKIIHKWEGPKLVGTGWQNFRDVIPGGHNTFYGLAADGSLLWYRHDGVQEGLPTWKGPVRVGTGWNVYKSVFGGGDGILYSVDQQGSLNWYRRTDSDDTNALSPGMASRGASTQARVPSPAARMRVATPAGSATGPGAQSQGPIRIAAGFGAFTQVFSAGQGIIYAITQDGRLLWFQHVGYLQGQPRLLGPKQVGSGWANMRHVFSPGDGVIYAISKTGDVLWYKHDGFLDGSQRWEGPTKISSDWNNFAVVFPHMWGTPQAPSQPH